MILPTNDKRSNEFGLGLQPKQGALSFVRGPDSQGVHYLKMFSIDLELNVVLICDRVIRNKHGEHFACIYNAINPVPLLRIHHKASLS